MDIQKTSIQKSALGWVRKAIDDYLSDIRTQLNRYQDDYDDALIENIKEQLITINGVLTMVEHFGAAMLSEEMVGLCDFLIAEERKKKDAPLEVLLRSVLQLPDYIERIQSGLTDLPLVILPLLNDIRAIQNKDLFSEKLLFLPKLSNDIEADLNSISANDVKRAQIYAKKIRPVFLFSLLNLIKEKDIDEQFSRLEKIAIVMEERSKSSELSQFWVIFSALIESISRADLEIGVSIKMLLGKVDGVIRSLIKDGEIAYIKQRPVDLIKNLLYYIAQPECNGPKTQAVKTAYQLEQYLPNESEREDIINSINGPNKALLDIVGESVKNDIEIVKSTLEVYVNGDLADVSRLAKVPEELHIISDTLGMVGMGAQREIIESKRLLIQSILDGEHQANQNELLLIAHDLLLVEDGLDNINKIQAAQQNESEINQDDFEFDSVLLAVVSAALDDFQKIKTSILDYIKDNSKTENLALCVSLLNESKGAMDLLGQPIVSDVMERLSQYIDNADKQFLSAERLDLFSDVIISIEFFLEALGEKREDVQTIAEHAESVLHTMLTHVDLETESNVTENAGQLADGEDSDDLTNDSTKSVVDVISKNLDEIHEVLEPVDTVLETLSDTQIKLYPKLNHIKVTPVEADKTVLTEGSDPDILEIYIEEAEEESANIKNNLRLWKNDLENENLLTTIRRSFHTIKGSGRLVGALVIGEFAWDFEELLNRLLAHTIKVTPDIVQCLTYSAEALPELIEQIKSGTEPAHDASYLRGIAQTLATYDAAETLLEIENNNKPDEASAVTSNEEGEALLLLPEDNIETASLAAISSDLEEIKLELEPDVLPVDSEGSDAGLGDKEGLIIEPDTHGIADGTVLAENSDSSLKMDKSIEQNKVSDIPLESIDEPTLDNPASVDVGLDVAGENPPDPFVETDSAKNPDIEQEGVGAPKSSESQEPLIDSELFAIYHQEVQTHISQIFSFLDDLTIDEEFDPTPIYRALHTVNGASKTARILSVGKFATAMEKPLRDIEEEQKVVFDHEVHQLYMQGTTQLSMMIDELEGAIDEPTYSLELYDEFTELCLNCSKKDEQNVDSAPDILSGSELADIPQEYDDTDYELLEIFLEEANDILNDSDQALFKWKTEIIENKETDSINTIMEMQRYLHTLKGGARMANFNSIADLSHEMESLFIDVLDNYVEINIELMDVLNDCFDLLADLVEKAGNKEPLPKIDTALHTLMTIRKGNAADVMSDDMDSSDVEMNTETVNDTFTLDDTQKSKDIIRVRSDLLDNLVNSAGEVSIYRSRMQQQVSFVNNNLSELDQTIARLKHQLRDLEAETDAQIRYSHKDNDKNDANYDPLEMDRYTKMQELSKSLSESVEDLSSLKQLMGEQLKGSETLLLQQSRISGDLQDGLIRSRMVKFSGLVSRLRRIVRQASADLGKKVELEVIGDENEIDNKVLDRMLSPLEHLLRNAVAHGIETPLERSNQGKPETGKITIEIRRESADIVIIISDDGSGIDKDKVRRRALQLGIIEDLSKVQDQDLIQLILEPGFSTEDKVTQISGRGVGMDVVDTEIKQLGGTLSIESKVGEGTRFKASLPFTLSVNQAILVEVGEESYAIPLNNIEGISRLDSAQLNRLYDEDNPSVDYAGNQYELHYLAPLLDIKKRLRLNDSDEKQPIILTRAGDIRLALHVDNIVGNREIVVKSLGKQLSQVKSLSGASILGDGRIVFILDISGLVKHGINTQSEVPEQNTLDEQQHVELPTVMVVDDSITMRRVAQKLLGRNNFEVITAKDGIDALSQLGDVMPDIMLLDIEMPRMDGFELATHMKKDNELHNIPIIMVTSRTGDKHRKHAKDIGVDRYMGKPYQEAELLQNINQLLEAV